MLEEPMPVGMILEGGNRGEGGIGHRHAKNRGVSTTHPNLRRLEEDKGLQPATTPGNCEDPISPVPHPFCDRLQLNNLSGSRNAVLSDYLIDLFVGQIGEAVDGGCPLRKILPVMVVDHPAHGRQLGW